MAKPKKWESFKGKLPVFVEPDADRRAQILNVKKSFSDMPNAELMLQMRDLKYEKKELEECLKGKQLILDSIVELLAERFENSGTQSTKIATGELFYLSDEPYTKVLDPKQTNEWVIQEGMDELRQVPWQTMNGIVKERLEKGEKLPPGVEVFMKTTVVMRKGS